jgi:hypothetical protein
MPTELEYYKVRESYCLAYDKAKAARKRAWNAFYYKAETEKSFLAWCKADAAYHDALAAFRASSKHYDATYGAFSPAELVS